MNKKRKDVIFITGVCKSSETKLLGKERLNRMAEAKSLADAFSCVKETPFGGGEFCEAEDFESLIAKEQILLCDFVREYAPSDEIENFCLAPLDFYNAEVAVKCDFLHLDAQKYFDAQGLYSYRQISEIVSGLNKNVIPELICAVEESKTQLTKGAGGMKTGNIFALKKYEYLLRITKNDYLSDIVKRQIDALNISVALRCDDYESAKQQIIPVGNIDDKRLNALVSLKKEEIEKAFASNSELKNLALGAVSAKLKGEPFVSLEREYLSYGAQRMIDSRFTEQSGTKPFMLYYFKRKNEIACVRTILTGKANGLEPERIKQRILSV